MWVTYTDAGTITDTAQFDTVGTKFTERVKVESFALTYIPCRSTLILITIHAYLGAYYNLLGMLEISFDFRRI